MKRDRRAGLKVAFFTGCFANYYYQASGLAVVEVLQACGVEVVVPKQVCCGLPMMAKGDIEAAYKKARFNAETLSGALAAGYALVTSCPSCVLFITRYYPYLLNDESSAQTSASLSYLSDFLLELYEKGCLNLSRACMAREVFYHVPCHLRACDPSTSTSRLLELLPGVTIKKTSTKCCGQAGASGFEKKNYDRSRRIGEKLFAEIEANTSDWTVTDCGTCKVQIESGAGVIAHHPIILVREALHLKSGGTAALGGVVHSL